VASLAILQADARAVARLVAALGPHHELALCSSWDALSRVLDRSSFDGCLVDVDSPSRAEARANIEQLRERHPATAIIACVEAGYPLAYYDLGGLGVAGILPVDRKLPAIRGLVDQALATARADGIARALEKRFGAPGPEAVAWAVEHAGPDTSVEKLAAALGHTPRSLHKALDEVGLPAPTRVLLWGRLLLAGARLGRDGRTVEDVAFSLGYATATSLARAMKSQTGLTPKEVSEAGGMDRVRDALFRGGAKAKRTVGTSPGPRAKIAALALATILGGCATVGLGSTRVDASAIDRILDAPPHDRVHFGVVVLDAESGETLYERNAERWFVPGSNQKILTTAAAWSRLGPNYRFRTALWATAPPGERLEGDLILVGSGDPSLSRRFWDSGPAALRALADSAAAAGIRQVAGALLVDASAWDSTTVLPTREVADLVFGYGATGGVFAIDEGEIRVVARGAARVGEPADLEWSPRGRDWFVLSRVRTVAPDSVSRVTASYLPETRQLVLVGGVGPGTLDTLTFAQRDPVRVASAELLKGLTEAGIAVDGGWDVRWEVGQRIDRNGAHSTQTSCLTGALEECPSAWLVASLESPPLGELVRVALEPSQNWVAEQLMFGLGAELGERGSLREGLDVVERFLVDDVGLDPLDVAPRDGSGLSAYNLVTPRAIARVLRFMAVRPDADAYRAAMAEPGEEESTLEERLLGLEGRVFAKTGTISNVNSLSGYLVREDGQEVIFVILSNGAGLDEDTMRSTIDDVVRVLAR
jgi:D-alanyl-D-alanine carboxypeptidase/D-alanyl-D-alanine-endopeptidase (penicillin-binding protein 4)